VGPATWDKWSGVLAYRFPQGLDPSDPRLHEATPKAARLRKHGMFRLMRNTVIPDMDMDMARKRNGGIHALPKVNAHTALEPYGAAPDEDVPTFLARVFGFMADNNMSPTVMAKELESGKHISQSSPARVEWIRMKQERSYMWEDVIDAKHLHTDKVSVAEAYQYLEDMALCILVTLSPKDTPITRVEVQARIDSEEIPQRNMGGIYALYKRILQWELLLSTSANGALSPMRRRWNL
jgi:hypothetical protein